MSKSELLETFLANYPDIDLFEVVLTDLSGGLRGKWLTRDKIASVFKGQLKLPMSSVVFDSWGRDVEEWVFLSGDGDGCCVPEPQSLAVMPWGKRPMAQVLVSLDHEDGDEFAGSSTNSRRRGGSLSRTRIAAGGCQ